MNLVDSLASKGGDILILRKFSIDKRRSIFWKWKNCYSNTVDELRQPSPQVKCTFFFILRLMLRENLYK